jgi:thiosulfate/3-mercaptopyruvate sulfurtransferase
MRTHLNLVVAGVLAAALVTVPVGAQRPQDSRDALVVSTAWLAQHLNDPSLVLLHLGVKTDYDASHIPGARFLTLNDIALTGQTSQTGLMLQMPAAEDLRARLEKLGISDTSRIVVSYGRDRISAATRVLFTLDHAGLGARASLLDGGMEAWVREGRPVTADVPPATAGKLSPLRVQQTIVDADYVRTHLSTPGTLVIDSRVKAFYEGAQTGGSAQRPHRTGHIAGAKNIPYTETIDEQQKLKPASGLAALFTAAGVKPGDTVVTYCHIGQQATAVAFAARTLGFKVLLYDGSFEDWSRRTELPVTNPSKK